MKNILITGSSGFIGSYLFKYLSNKSFNVITFNSSNGDISETDLISLYKDIDIYHIFHLASYTFVPNSWANPFKFYKTSVLGTCKVLELCRNKNTSLTYISAYLYGIPKNIPICEDHDLNPNNPYAHSKKIAEDLCAFYHNAFGLNICIVRPFNIYGYGQKDVFLIPKILNQALHNDIIELDDLEPKRDFLYIKDFVDAVARTIDLKKSFCIYNLGSGEMISVEEVLAIILDTLGIKKPIKSQDKKRINELKFVCADITKAKKDLKWNPKFDFKSGIKDMIEEMMNDK